MASLGVLALLAGCASTPPAVPWQARLQGNAIVLLGEIHDNVEHHQHRLAVLKRAFAAGWRPAIAMEQLDRERQPSIERARAEKPRDAQHLIAAAMPLKATPGSHWNWDHYRPFIELALEYDVPLVAANLSSADSGRIVREGLAAVFDADALRRLSLNQAVPTPLQAAQEREIDSGHCNALPAKLLPAMARAQLARDAVMAEVIARHAAHEHGVVLIAGNGHVRRDIGVPRWLSDELRARTLVVGYLETSRAPEPDVAFEAAFDAVVRVTPAKRDDPCIAFRQRLKRP